MSEPAGQSAPARRRRVSTATKTWAAAIIVATIVAVIIGLILSSGQGLTPIEGYLLTLILTALSVAAGWIINLISQELNRFDDLRDAEHHRQMVEQNARSAVVGVFRTLEGLGRVMEITGNSNGGVADLRIRLDKATVLAGSVFANAGDSIEDWRRFAPDAVEDELQKVRQPGTGHLSGAENEGNDDD